MSDLKHLYDTIFTEEEFVLPGEKRLELKKGGRAWRKREREKKARRDQQLERILARKKAQSDYYRRNKKVLNEKRRLRNNTPEYAFQKARQRAKDTGIPWELTIEEWVDIWNDAPRVVNPANGYLVPAWQLRGSNPQECAQMVRRDSSKGWTSGNAAIAYKTIIISEEQDNGDGD